ncbi:MAG: glycogen synthase, partial [Gammaproteobacteria bacterium]
MVAAENDALPGLKVGGIGDVLRDLPPALAELGCSVTVVTPAYGLLDALPEPRRLATVEAGFRGVSHHVELYEVNGGGAGPRVRHLVLDHAAFSPCGRGEIYCNDAADAPFATDASKFALFSDAVAEGLVQGSLGAFDVLHLHDWHTALVLLLARYQAAFRSLRELRSVFTVHNLGLQGVRPLRGDSSSLETWYPGLRYDRGVVSDPRWPDCVNPMAVGIRLADVVHTVSPSYAEEIVLPSAVAARGYHGGEGLEADLADAQSAQRLHGFLNGCEYPESTAAPRNWDALRALMDQEILRWSGEEARLSSAHFIARSRLAALPAVRPAVLLTSVGRITEQKMRLLHEPTSSGRPALDALLDLLGDDGRMIVLGSGDAALEQFLVQTSARRDNLIYLRGYSDALSGELYGAGDLFVMPSSYEPCGISQMLALRAGQPCLVHAVGGLRDTVTAGVNGFVFGGDSLTAQAD